jgi:hypothetical protein
MEADRLADLALVGNIIKTDLKETMCKDMYWIQLAEDRVQCRDFVKK